MEKISLEYKQRDIILIPFPFSNQRGAKIRPALIISNNYFNHSEDIIVSGITSNINRDKYTVHFEEKDLEQKNIKENCCIKVENILKIEKSLIIKKIDSIKEEPFEKALSIVKDLF